MIRAVAYIRVSTDRQELGPEAQRAAIEAWAINVGAEVVAWHEDRGVSGATEPSERPGLMAALAAIRLSKATVLIAQKRDRLARDVIGAAVLEKMAREDGAEVLTCDGTPAGDGPEAVLMRTILDAFAQYERALIRGRIKVALAAKKARGEHIGPPEYGKDKDGQAIEAECQTAGLIRAMKADGATLQAIADRLNADGIATKRTKVDGTRGKWHPSTVKGILDARKG